MPKYNVLFYGRIGVRNLEYEETFIDDKWARRHVEMSLPHYYPVYDRVVVWRNAKPSPEPHPPGREDTAEVIADLKATLNIVGAS